MENIPENKTKPIILPFILSIGALITFAVSFVLYLRRFLQYHFDFFMYYKILANYFISLIVILVLMVSAKKIQSGNREDYLVIRPFKFLLIYHIIFNLLTSFSILNLIIAILIFIVYYDFKENLHHSNSVRNRIFGGLLIAYYLYQSITNLYQSITGLNTLFNSQNKLIIYRAFYDSLTYNYYASPFINKLYAICNNIYILFVIAAITIFVLNEWGKNPEFKLTLDMPSRFYISTCCITYLLAFAFLMIYCCMALGISLDSSSSGGSRTCQFEGCNRKATSAAGEFCSYHSNRLHDIWNAE